MNKTNWELNSQTNSKPRRFHKKNPGPPTFNATNAANTGNSWRTGNVQHRPKPLVTQPPRFQESKGHIDFCTQWEYFYLTPDQETWKKWLQKDISSF